MKNLILFICVTAWVCFCANSYMNRNMPNPYDCFGSYGFKIGKTYNIQRIKKNPFNSPDAPFTRTVIGIKEDYVQFDNPIGLSNTIRLGSIGSGFYEFKEIVTSK